MNRRAFSTGCVAASALAQAQAQAPGIAPVLPSLAPSFSSPMNADSISRLAEVVRDSRKLLVITGAGISTPSGIASYRGPGIVTPKPIQHGDFVRNEATRRRYWMRSFFGYAHLSQARPASCHLELAVAQLRGEVNHIITQNVDGLHYLAGSPSDGITELHGTIHKAECLECGTAISRSDLQEEILRHNSHSLRELEEHMAASRTALSTAPGMEKTITGAKRSHQGRRAPEQSLKETKKTNSDKLRPDGDLAVDDDVVMARTLKTFISPSCHVCGGMLKPSVVFFGGTLDVEVGRKAVEFADEADAVLVLGSSLSTFSAYKLVHRAVSRRAPVGIVTIGPTRADSLEGVIKVEGLCDPVLHDILTTARGNPLSSV